MTSTATAALSSGNDVLIVGAGITGLACARSLRAAGVSVTVLDKGLSPGGRTALRRVGAFTFDHGAQYFTARGEAFSREVASWETLGVVARWPEAGDDRYVGVPSMSAIARHLGDGLDVRFGVHVDGVSLRDGAVIAHTHDGHTLTARALVSTLPAPQAGTLLATLDAIAEPLARVTMDPCWAVCVAFEPRPFFGADVLRSKGPLAWACRDGSKPGREAHDTWMLHGSPAFSAEMLEADGADVTRVLLEELAREVGPLPAIARTFAHRWRYARVREPLGVPFLAAHRGAASVMACGDFAFGSRVEDAYRSGIAAAEALAASFTNGRAVSSRA